MIQKMLSDFTLETVPTEEQSKYLQELRQVVMLAAATRRFVLWQQAYSEKEEYSQPISRVTAGL